ncbi:MAG: glycosyltransferase family 1 protein, partial [Muribaculaceae bacterium]|nr:glycosyltransferase family 1 protein [Muribaculaceae bacterium]
MKKLFMIVNEDRFFLSHRLPVALAAKRGGFDVTIVTKDTGRSADIVAAGFRFINLPINPVGMNPVEEIACYRFLRNLYRAE